MSSNISEPIDTLNSPENHWFGIGIEKTSEITNHSSIVYYDSSTNEKKMLHLGWHNDLNLEIAPDNFRWVRLTEEFDEDNARDFAQMCNWIFETNKNNVPYGVRFDGALINETTNKIEFKDGEAVGLTCATFSMLVFNRFGIELIDGNTWEKRDSDKIWFDFLLKYLKPPSVPVDHVSIVTKEIPCARVRPEEIAASCRLTDKPNTFQNVIPPSETLLVEITEHYNK